MVEQFGKESKNRLKRGEAIAPVWVVVTSQEKLNEVVAVIDSKRVELARYSCWADECLQRHIHTQEDQEEEKVQYYAYVVEANLVFPNGLSLPLMSVFLEYDEKEL